MLTSDNGVLTLSNYRVKYDSAANGSSKLMSITLDAVSSCGLVALCFVVAYYMTRSSVITISSNGGEHIDVPTKGMKLESIRAFVEVVVEAKLNFIGKLGGK